MNTFFKITKIKQHEQDNEQQRPEDMDVPGPSSAKCSTLSNIDDDYVLNELTETLASNMSLNESHDCLASNMSLNERHDCSLELHGTENTADQNENNDDDDDDNDDDAEEDSDNEIYAPSGPGFASPDVALDNHVYEKQKYLNQHI